MSFQGDSGFTPDLGTIRVDGKLVAGGSLVTNNPGSLKPDSGDPETETGSLETEKRVHRIHGTLETGLQIMLRSLVAPSRGAGGFVRRCCHTTRLIVTSSLGTPRSVMSQSYRAG